MASTWEGIIHPNTLYSPKELGGAKGEKRGILAMSYSSIIRDIVDNPRYARYVSAKYNERGTYRSNIQILGLGVIQYLEDNRLDRVA